jgi:hypothetical protein
MDTTKKPDYLRLVLCAAALSVCATSAMAAGRSALSEAQATYNRDRAACMSSEHSGDRATCLKEAAAALQEAKRGGLSNEQAQFDRNRLARCESQPPQDREECVRRMNEGTVSGSVQGGGIYRELVTPVRPSR